MLPFIRLINVENRHYFQRIFRDVLYSFRFDVIEIHGALAPLPDRCAHTLYVQYCTDLGYRDPLLYDLNLIPHAYDVDKRCIPHSACMEYLHQHGLTDVLCKKRKYGGPGSGGLRGLTFDPENTTKRHLDTVAAFAAFAAARTGYNHRFELCFETERGDYYATDRIVRAYLSGSVPIYWGCPQIATMFNAKAFIYLEGKVTAKSLALLTAVIEHMDLNDAAYRRVYEEPLLLDADVMSDLSERELKEKIDCMVQYFYGS